MKSLIFSTLILAAVLPASADMLTCTGSYKGGDYQINIDNDSEHQPYHVAVFNEAKQSTVFNAENIKNSFTQEGFVIRAVKKSAALKIRFPEQSGEVSDGDARPVVLVSGKLPAVGFSSQREVEFRCQ